MPKPNRLITGLLLAALIAFSLPAGIVRAQCDGTAEIVECTGVDPDGWNATYEAPDSLTEVTIRPGALVEGRITLDGDDTLIIEAGGTLNFSSTGNAYAVLDNGISDHPGVTTIANNGTLIAKVTRTPDWIGPGIGIYVNENTARAINNGTMTVRGVASTTGILGHGPQIEVINNNLLNVETTRGSGVYVWGRNGRFINTGLVTVHGYGLVGLRYEGGNVRASNAGTIALLGQRLAQGVWGSGWFSQVVNMGVISAKTFGHPEGHAHGAALNSHAIHFINTGTILVRASGWRSEAFGILIYWPGTRVINTGIITAEGAQGVGIGTTFGGQVVLYNTGTISGSTASFHALYYSVAVINRGMLNGDVILGRDDDSFTAEGGVVNGIIDGGEGNDTLTFAFAVPEADYPAVAAQIAAASPAGGTLTYGGATYTWVNFEKIVNRLNGIFHVPPITEVVIAPIPPTPGAVVASAPAAASEIVSAVPPAVCNSGDFGDGRLNGLDPAATAIVYPYGLGGLDLYTPQGEWAIRADADALIAALTQAAANGAPVEVDARLGLALVAQPDGSLLATGPGYTFAFQPDRCGLDL